MRANDWQLCQNLQAVDIIVVSYYTGDILFECIAHLLNLSLLNKIIIVNNGNPPVTEQNLKQLAEEHLQITLITGHGNIGFAKACNMAANVALAPFLLFLNPDCIIQDANVLKQFISGLKSNNTYKVATCLILNSDGSIQKTCRRNLLTPLVAIGESFNLYKLSAKFAPLNLPITDIAKLKSISTVPALSGAVIFTTRQYYLTIGGLNEEYFLHVEDMDLSMRVHLLGDKIAFLKDIKIIHALSTSKTTTKFLEQCKAQGYIIYIFKYFPKYRGFCFKYVIKGLIYLRYLLKVIL